jgi:hypothetical protein
MKNNDFSIDDLLSEDTKKITPAKPVGAPKKKIKKDEKLMVYMTKPELELIIEKAAKLEVSKASFVRIALLEYFKEH